MKALLTYEMAGTQGALTRVPAVLAQSRRETIPIHDYTGAGTSFSAHHGTKTLRTNVSEMKALLTYEMVGTQGALTPQIH